MFLRLRNLVELLRQLRHVVAFSAVLMAFSWRCSLSRDAPAQLHPVRLFQLFACRYHPDHWIGSSTWTWVYHFPRTSTNPDTRICYISNDIAALGQLSEVAVPNLTPSPKVPNSHAFSLLSTWAVEPANLPRPRLQPMLSSTRCPDVQRLSAIPPPADPMAWMIAMHCISNLHPRGDQTG